MYATIGPASAIILAGGRSGRMGTDKALLHLHHETLLERTVRLLRTVADDVVVVGPARSGLQVDATFVADSVPAQGPLRGLVTGLGTIANEWAFVTACDAPCLSPVLVRAILHLRSDGVDAVVPMIDNVRQPLHAAYRRAVKEAVQGLLDTAAGRQGSLMQALDLMQVRYISESSVRLTDPDLSSFVRINTPSEWQFFLARHEGCNCPT